MSKPISPTKPTPRKTAQSVPPRKRPTTSKSKPRQRRPAPREWNSRHLLLLALEGLGLALAAVLGIMFVLGSSAHWLSGSGFFAHLLPFATGVVILVVGAAGLLLGWAKLRGWLSRHIPALPAILAAALALASVWFVLHEGYTPVFSHFRSLVGGKQEAGRITLAHQVYAAYRRYPGGQLQAMIKRAEVFNPAIIEAAKIYGLDVHILQGVAATESSFMPRDSHDGGHGLFQITAVPKSILQQAADALDVDQPNLSDQRHNAFIAAATLQHYLQEMHGDLFLGLLAYNIGPRNGGLRFIMQQYGATDFVTLQPYLQQLPRDYPIRVLSYALAFSIWQEQGKLLAYEEGENARIIQRLGVPGLAAGF